MNKVTWSGDDPIIAQSALKHGLTTRRSCTPTANPVRAWDLGDEFTMIIGANQAALILEVGDIQGTTAVVPSTPCGPARDS